MTTDELRAHRAELLVKSDRILEEFAAFRTQVAEDREADRVEYAARAHRFRLALWVVGALLAIGGALGWANHQNATNLQRFVECQADFNDSYNKAAKARSEATQIYSKAVKEFAAVRTNPLAAPEAVNEARTRYFATLTSLTEVQAKNPLPTASNCRRP